MFLRFRLAKLMKEKGISEKELYERAGVARNTVRAMSRNATVRVDFESVEKIATALGVKPTELFEDTDEARGFGSPALALA